jgi:hypothetical protein
MSSLLASTAPREIATRSQSSAHGLTRQNFIAEGVNS